MNTFCTIALLFALFIVCFGKKSHILKLNDGNFLETSVKCDRLLALLHVPWTAKRNDEVLSTLKIVAEAMVGNNTNISIGQMDCSKEGADTCQILQVNKYPQLEILKTDNSPYIFDGPMDPTGMAMHLRIMVKKPGSFELKSNTDLNTFMAFDKVVTVISFVREENELKEMYLKTAIELEDKCRFAHISYEDSDFKEDGLEGNIIIYHPEHLHNKFEEKSFMFQGDTSDELKTFIAMNYHGLVGVRNSENSDDFKNPLVVAYYKVDFKDNAEETKQWRNLMLSVATNFRNQFNFAISAKDDYADIDKQYGIKFEDRKEPYILARDSKNRKFVMKEELSEASLTKFVNNILNKTIKNYILSQPVPDWNNGYVKVAVYNNFKSLVLKNPKDIFILFYAPWCSHCTSLLDTFEDLGTDLVYEDVDIVKMDVTENDVQIPFNVKRFPDMFWYPKDKTKPIAYEEGREVKDFIRYIAKHATVELKKYDRKGEPKKNKNKEEL